MQLIFSVRTLQLRLVVIQLEKNLRFTYTYDSLVNYVKFNNITLTYKDSYY